MKFTNQAFFASLFLSRLADQILLFLVPLVVYQTTGSVMWSGTAFFLETLPRFVSFPICGALCDRISSIRLLHVSQALRGAVSLGGIAGYVMFGGLGWLVGISALCGVLTTQGLMAREVMLPQVFREEKYEKVISYAQIADQVGMVLGPLVAAALLKVWAWEYVVAFTAVLFLGADAAVTFWERAAKPTLAKPELHQGRWYMPLVTALRHILHLPGLVDIVFLAAGVNLVIGVTTATSAAMVTGLQAQTDQYYAVLQAIGAIATVAILFFVAHTAIRVQILGAVSFVLILFGSVLTGLSTNPLVYAIGFVVVIGFDKMFSIYIRSLRQKIIPQKDFGKTTGLVVMLNNLSQPLAGLMVAFFSGLLGVQVVILIIFLIMGITGIVVAAVMSRRIQHSIVSRSQ